MPEMKNHPLCGWIFIVLYAVVLRIINGLTSPHRTDKFISRPYLLLFHKCRKAFQRITEGTERCLYGVRAGHINAGNLKQLDGIIASAA